MFEMGKCNNCYRWEAIVASASLPRAPLHLHLLGNHPHHTTRNNKGSFFKRMFKFSKEILFKDKEATFSTTKGDFLFSFAFVDIA